VEYSIEVEAVRPAPTGPDDAEEAPMAVRRLNHAVLRVSDVRRAAGFWSEVLGMDTVQETPGAVFLRLPGSGNHHDLGLFAAVGGPPIPDGVGLYHLAWEVEAFDDLGRVRAHLVELGALAGESDHGATLSLYAKDPDGIEFEVMWQLPRDEWGAHESAAVVRRLDWSEATARWAGSGDLSRASEEGGDLLE